ncbi:MAG: nuclear transport factor 2 family protein [Rhodobacter sp.]|nr:nuclear transport factor 2 family protein [Rhodobacter sp.]
MHVNDPDSRGGMKDQGHSPRHPAETEMMQDHPNISLLMKLDLRDLDGSADLFAEDFVWHYFNPKLPDVQGDYVGVAGLKDFFGSIGSVSGGTFKVEPIAVIPAGDELVVTHVRDTMDFQNRPIAIDAVVVWRVVDGRFAEAWDIPSAFTTANPRGTDDAQA